MMPLWMVLTIYLGGGLLFLCWLAVPVVLGIVIGHWLFGEPVPQEEP